MRYSTPTLVSFTCNSNPFLANNPPGTRMILWLGQLTSMIFEVTNSSDSCNYSHCTLSEMFTALLSLHDRHHVTPVSNDHDF